jgi:hypothetical protein
MPYTAASKRTWPCPKPGFWWRDYYASADPVSNGPILSTHGQASADGQAAPAQPWLPDGPCNQVYNSASILFDHNRYLRNQDQMLSRLMNDLTAAAYGVNPDGPAMVHEDDLKQAGQRRHRLVLLLIAARIIAPVMAAVLWLINPGLLLYKPVNQLAHLLAPHIRMGDSYARFLAATLLTAAVYLAAFICWRIREDYVIKRFFRTARRDWGTQPQRQHEPAKRTAGTQMSATSR